MDGYFPLHYAVANRSLNCVRHLIERGVDLNTADFHGSTPLHLAVAKKCPLIVELLLKANANADACNVAGESPMQMAENMVPEGESLVHINSSSHLFV